MPVILNINITINDPSKDSYLIDTATTVNPSVVLDIGSSLFNGQNISVVIKQNASLTGVIAFGPTILFSSAAPSLPATSGAFIRIQGTVINGHLYCN